ncbi:beta-Ig-H3/Fasciclin [Ostreococcus tauri]|uniref:Beta-Ig-H3/Fasciclin n=2 Tax=root TaxID=1 RepID=A0A1Y5I5E5_OSTTA|nr:beta-Ig-H3/Fasciclin [Ostreococcus tauri]
MKGTISDIASEDPRFTTLVALVEQAGLTGELDSDTKYTVFAPTNAAFEKLDPELVSKLKSGEANDKLTAILKAHVVEGETLSSDIANGEMNVATLAGSDVAVTKTDDSVMIDNATVVAADIQASNGVIHAVDTVIMPDDES